MTRITEDGSVEFRFYRPQAARVDLVGDFNDWNEGSNCLESLPGGWWIARLRLEPGEYRFRYLADGIWFADYAAHGIEAGPFGWTAVLVVRQPALSAEISPAQPALAGGPASN